MNELDYRSAAAERKRARILASLLNDLERARNSGAEWYVWIRDSYPLMKRGNSGGLSRRVSRV